jgi:hypothetical protein
MSGIVASTTEKGGGGGAVSRAHETMDSETSTRTVDEDRVMRLLWQRIIT